MPINCGPQKLLVAMPAQQPVFAAVSRTENARFCGVLRNFVKPKAKPQKPRFFLSQCVVNVSTAQTRTAALRHTRAIFCERKYQSLGPPSEKRA